MRISNKVKESMEVEHEPKQLPLLSHLDVTQCIFCREIITNEVAFRGGSDVICPSCGGRLWY